MLPFATKPSDPLGPLLTRAFQEVLFQKHGGSTFGGAVRRHVPIREKDRGG
jgi:hypothetical protein